MRLTYLSSMEDSAIKYYRQVLPASALRKFTGTHIQAFSPGQPLDKLAEACASDIFIFQGLSDQKWINFAKEMQGEGKKIVVDLDDNLFRVNPLSPHYQDFGVEEFIWRFPNGDVQHVWKDKVNIDLEQNRKNLEKVKEGLKTADLITVTTPVLADAYRPYGRDVAVLPNCIDLGTWKRLPLLPHKKVRIGWFGGHSHYHDWMLLKKVLPVLSKKYPQVQIVIMGQIFWDAMKGVDPTQIEVHSWVHNYAYPYKAAALDLDIAIIPLQEDDFNICKSSIKWVEMGALEVPCVSSYISPYKEMHEGDNGVFVENDTDAWVDGISYLVDNPLDRVKMGKAARRYVEANFDIEKKYKLWENTYEGLLKGVTV